MPDQEFHNIFALRFDIIQKQSGKALEVVMELGVEQKRCLERLTWAIHELGGVVEPAQLESISELIIQTMTGPWRFFHTPEHIFEVGGAIDPIEVLAALFHDLVYVQVDHGVNLNISNYISPYVKEVQKNLVIRSESDLPSQRIFEIIVCVFGFKPEMTLSPFAGQNEFLSALIAGFCLQPFLSDAVIAKIAACIEATVPFRAAVEGVSAVEKLHYRLNLANERFNFGWSEEQVIAVVHRSVRLANRDVENFATPNSANFLDNTWNLMPETNHHLGVANTYTVRQYRESLQKMEGFMGFLQPELVFQQFRGEPDDATYQGLIERTAKNLEVARLYLGSKLLSIAILEALSYRLGQDLPISTLMGELPTSGRATPALENFLPDLSDKIDPLTPMEKEVLELLSKGRTKDSNYDLKNSPVTTFLVQAIGFDEIKHQLKVGKDFFAGNLSAEDFLSQCNSQVVKGITEGMLKLFDSRKAALAQWN